MLLLRIKLPRAILNQDPKLTERIIEEFDNEDVAIWYVDDDYVDVSWDFQLMWKLKPLNSATEGNWSSNTVVFNLILI